MKTAKHYRLMDDLDFFNLELRKAQVEVEIYQSMLDCEYKSNRQKGQYKRWLAYWENEVKGNENCIKRIQEEIAIEVELYEAQQETDTETNEGTKTMNAQKQLLINIGLEQGASFYDPKGYLNGSEKQPLERVLSLLERVLPSIKTDRVLEATSNTERTLVIKAHTHGNMDAVQRSLDTLSGLLGQQAIAFTLNGTGAMAKHPTEPPRDSSWLVFNPEYFLIAGLPVSLEQFTE